MNIVGWIVGPPLVLTVFGFPLVWSVGAALVSLCAVMILAELQGDKIPAEGGVASEEPVDVG